MSIKKLVMVIWVSGCMTAGCASIPKEAPALSEEIGQRISAIEASHINLVYKYFDLKRAEVDRIITEEWIPAYLKSFFSHPETKEYWNRLKAEGDKETKLQFLAELSPRLLEEIRSKRAEFMKPLNELERELEMKLRAEYRQVLAANNVLTSFLVSSSDIAENRERYLNILGVEQDIYGKYIEKADHVLEDLKDRISQED